MSIRYASAIILDTRRPRRWPTIWTALGCGATAFLVTLLLL